MSSNNEYIYYVYAYIRAKDSDIAKAGTPYYIGKGKGKRAWSKQHNATIPTNSSLIIILEKNLSDIGAKAIERRLIRWYGRVDNNTGILRNLTDGGEGFIGLVFSDEHRRKLSVASKGKKKSIEHRQKLSDVNKGRKNVKKYKRMSPTEETRKKQSDIMKGRKYSDEHRKRISVARTGMKFSKEHIENMSKAQKIFQEMKRQQHVTFSIMPE